MPASSPLSQLAVLREVNSYSGAGDQRKNAMHRCGRAFLRQVAKDLGLPKGSYDLRSNLGGMAVSGEVTLHTERLYLQISESPVGGGGVSILARSCRGRNDYVGGQNNWHPLARIAQGGYPGFLAQCTALSAADALPAQRPAARAA